MSEDINLSTYWDSYVTKGVPDTGDIYCSMRILQVMDQDQVKCNKVAERTVHMSQMIPGGVDFRCRLTAFLPV